MLAMNEDLVYHPRPVLGSQPWSGGMPIANAGTDTGRLGVTMHYIYM